MGKQHYVVIATTYTIVLGVVSLISLNGIVVDAPEYSDKLFHLLAYTILSFLWYKFFVFNYTFNKALLKASLLAIVFGIIIEVLQHVVTTTRTFDFNDILANSIGVLISVLVLSFRNKIEVKKQ